MIVEGSSEPRKLKIYNILGRYTSCVWEWLMLQAQFNGQRALICILLKRLSRDPILTHFERLARYVGRWIYYFKIRPIVLGLDAC